MFNAAFAAKVYVLGDPEQLPERDKTLPVRIRVVDRPTYGKLLIELYERSNMKGYTTNYPVDDSDNTTDMLLLQSDNSDWTDLGTGVLKYEWASYTGATTFEITVNVRCYDYGAWGTLKATLYKRTGTDANGNDVYEKAGSAIGTVPRDENGNHIADGWNNDFYPYKWKSGSSDALPKEVHDDNTRASGVKDYPYSVPEGADRQQTVDKETGPTGNGENGDGLTVFEEYRGVMTQQYGGYGGGATGHTRSSPESKDVFCVVHSSVSSYGIGETSRHPDHSFIELHPICVSSPFGTVHDANHDFDSSASTLNGWLNSNSGGIPDIHYVYAVRVKNGGKHPTNTSSLGFAPINRPFYLSLGNIYMDTIITLQKEDLPGKSVTDIAKAVIAHEIGHMINLTHCPQNCIDNKKGECLMFPDAVRYDSLWQLVENISIQTNIMPNADMIFLNVFSLRILTEHRTI